MSRETKQKLGLTINVDLIAILNSQETGLPDFFGGTLEQQVITNEAQIPVMCVNPAKVTLSGGVLFS